LATIQGQKLITVPQPWTNHEVGVVNLLALLFLGSFELYQVIFIRNSKSIQIKIIHGRNVRLGLPPNVPYTHWLPAKAFLCLMPRAYMQSIGE